MSIVNTYQDAVVSGGGNRIYELVPTSGGRAYINDVTTYSVTGSNFGAEDANQLAEGYCRLDTSAASGTVDGDLFQLITDMGWSDVIIS